MIAVKRPSPLCIILSLILLIIVLAGCSARAKRIPTTSPTPVAGIRIESSQASVSDCPQDCTQNPFVHGDGTQLKDGNGNPIKLRGVNLGGWLLWEGWIWGGGFDSETTILERLNELAGSAETEAFRDQIYRNFITEKDIARIAELGFNVVRIPLNSRLLEDDNQPLVYRQAGWEILDQVIGWCEKHHVYVVLTLHSAPGGQSKMFTADPDGAGKLWADESLQERTVALWKAIAERYHDRETVAGFDLLNEPDPPSAEEMVALYRRIITSIRSVDPYHMVIIEGANYSRDFSAFDSPLSYNQAYSFHIYTWFGDNRREQLAQFRDISARHNVPMWNGEFGENQYDMLESTAAMLDDPEYDLAGWAFWTWKKVPNRYPFLREIRTTDAWDKVIQWIERPQWPSKKPSHDEAAAGMKDFVSSVSFDNTQEDPQMTKILTGAVSR